MCAARVAEAVVQMMEGVTTPEGTAPGAAVPGYRVAGKTGTSRIVGPEGYDDTRHVAWFVGMVPASQPRFVMAVMINDPKAGLSGGGAVAAPVFAQVAERALRLLGVPYDARLLADAGIRLPLRVWTDSESAMAHGYSEPPGTG